MKKRLILISVCICLLFCGCAKKADKKTNKIEIDENITQIDYDESQSDSEEKTSESIENEFNYEELTIELANTLVERKWSSIKNLDITSQSSYVEVGVYSGFNTVFVIWFDDEDRILAKQDDDNDIVYIDSLVTAANDKSKIIKDEKGRIIFEYDGYYVYTYEYNDEGLLIRDEWYDATLDITDDDVECIISDASVYSESKCSECEECSICEDFELYDEKAVNEGIKDAAYSVYYDADENKHIENWITEYEYDSDGNVVKESYYVGLDEKPNGTKSFLYENRLLVKTERGRYIEEYKYDVDNRIETYVEKVDNCITEFKSYKYVK